MLDAVERVTGATPYATTMRLPGMLVAKVLRSPHAHARIAHLDTSAAAALPGVAAVLTAADLLPPAGPGLYYGVNARDQPVLAHERVRFVGEPVAAVAAASEAAAEEALRRIAVAYEPMPAVFDPAEAAAPGAPLLHPGRADNLVGPFGLRRGDPEAGFAAADLVVEECFTCPAAHHLTLEPHVALAQWEGERLTVWTPAQAPFAVRRVLAELFALRPADVRVLVPPLGGGYGGKGHVRVEPLAAALARKTGGRPVRLLLSRAESFVTVTRHAARITISSGVRRDGTITARRVRAEWNVGAYADASPGLVQSAVARLVGPYNIPNVHVDSVGAFTNLPSAGAYRGAMSTQAAWAYESHADTLARRLGLDPLELRRRNLLREGDTLWTGETLHDIHFAECLEQVARDIGWDAPLQRGAGRIRRGRGLAVMMKSTLASSRSAARLSLDQAGLLTLHTATVEMGQGAHTALALEAAASVGLSPAAVRVAGPDTAAVPFDTSTNASRSTEMMGAAIRDAAGRLRAAILAAASDLLGLPAAALRLDDGQIIAEGRPGLALTLGELLRRCEVETLAAEGEAETKGGLDPQTGQGVATPHWHQGAGACEVEVDTETGQVRVLRYSAAAYAGRVVSPPLARLQNDGNVIFGLGSALQEAIVYSEGAIANATLEQYKVPSTLDLPGELRSVCVETPGAAPVGIGEMTLPPVAPAIANAIEDAVGVRLRDLPLRPEAVLRALREQNQREER